MRKEYYTPKATAIVIETESILQYSLQKSSDRADIEIEVLSRRRGSSESNDNWMDE